MVTITFYEKPGCINNTRQKKMLREAGHTVIAKDLLTENWSENPLLLHQYFKDKPVYEWFNRSAPAIKKGEINPNTLNPQQAIELMLTNPLLIHRPLMQVGNEKMAGFNEQAVDRWIGLSRPPRQVDLESCPKEHCSDFCHD